MKKGFTLIELLAVIIVIAVIALIATPIILNVIENSRKGAFKDSSLSIFSAAEYYILDNKIAETGPDGIDISLLKLKNSKQFLSGKIYYENNQIRIDYVTDGVYCVHGYLNNLVINKDACYSDKDSPVITISSESSSWMSNLDITFEVSDTLDIKYLKYKIVEINEIANEIDWIEVDGNNKTISLIDAGTYILYIEASDIADNVISKTYGLYQIMSYDNYKVLADLAGLNSSDYISLNSLITNSTAMNTIMNNQQSINYLYDSVNTGSTLLNSVLANITATTHLINSSIALKTLSKNSIWVNAIKGSSNYVGTYVNLLLATTNLTNLEKYNATLPCYFYNNGNEYSEVSGGWTMSLSGSTSCNAYTYTENPTNIYLLSNHISCHASSSLTVSTSTPDINVNGYNHLKISYNQFTNSNGGIYVGYTGNLANNSYNSSTNGNKTLVFDITSLVNKNIKGIFSVYSSETQGTYAYGNLYYYFAY